MKTKIKSIIILVVMSLNVMAQFSERKTVIRKDHKGIVQSLVYSNEDETVRIPESADEFFKTVLKTQTADRFDKKPHKSNREEYVHDHFDQYYNGVKVEGGGYNFHYRNGEMYFAHGNYIKIEELNTRPSITADDAKTVFSDYKKIPVDLIIKYYSELMIKEIPIQNDTLPMLVYRVRLIADHPENTDVGFIDAQTGKILYTGPALINVSAIGTFDTRYSGSRQAHTDMVSTNSYRLFDNTRGATIHTRNLNGSTIYTNGVELTDSDNEWKASEYNSSKNDMALDIHWALQQIYDRLYNVHGKNSFDDDGFPINAYFKFGNIAYYQDNAFWDFDNYVLYFGVGNTKYKPVASLDAVAHEFGHGITNFQIGWKWDHGIDITQASFCEGMSDIWGMIMEYRIKPNNVWQIGEQIMNNNKSCLRNIGNPNDSNSETQIATTYSTSTNSNYYKGDKYVKSGVFSRWFYLLVNGGSGTNDIGNSYQVYGIGMDHAENLIVEAVYNNYLRNTTNWTSIRSAFVQAASALNGGQCGLIAQQVENAWYAVGVGTQPTQISISGPSYVCPGTPQTFTAHNFPGTVTWTSSPHLSRTVVGNSVTVASNPSDLILYYPNPSNPKQLVPLTLDGYGDYNGWIKATVTINGTPISVEKNLVTNKSYIYDLTVFNDGKAQNQNTIYTIIPSTTGPANVSWSWNNSINVWFNTSTFFMFDINPSYSVTIIASNSHGICGGSNQRSRTIPSTRGGISPIVFYPNPVADILYIEIDEEAFTQFLEQNNTDSKSLKISPTFDIRLYDGQGNLLRQATTKGGSSQFNVSNLPNGIYYLHIYDGISDNIEIWQIMVER